MSVVAFPFAPAVGTWWQTTETPPRPVQIVAVSPEGVDFTDGEGLWSLSMASFRWGFVALQGPAPEGWGLVGDGPDGAA